MEEILLRFPMLGKEIFKKIDNKTLVNCRQIDETWMGFIDNEKFRWTRIIQKYTVEALLYFNSEWRKAIRRSSTKEVSKLAHSLYEFQKVRVSKTISPFLIAALTGDLNLIDKIFQGESDKNPMGARKCTPLHYVAGKGDLLVCKWII